jgi:hypothetical protein
MPRRVAGWDAVRYLVYRHSAGPAADEDNPPPEVIRVAIASDLIWQE